MTEEHELSEELDIVLPPTVASRRQSLMEAYRGYKTQIMIHERALAEHHADLSECRALIDELDSTAKAFAGFMDQELPAPEKNHVDADEISPRERRERRDVKGLVYAALSSSPLGLTENDLVKKLNIQKVQAQTVLARHLKEGNVRLGASGVWFVVQDEKVREQLNPNPDQASEPAGLGIVAPPAPEPPTTLLDVIQAAGAVGISDDELAERGYPFIDVMRLLREGAIKSVGGNRYAIIGAL